MSVWHLGTLVAIRPSGSLFWLGALLWVGSCMALGIRTVRAQRAYVRLYRERHRIDLPLTDEVADRYLCQPWRYYVEGWGLAWRRLKILWERQTDPELEAARRRAVGLWRVTIAVAWLGALLPILFSTIRV